MPGEAEASLFLRSSVRARSAWLLFRSWDGLIFVIGLVALGYIAFLLLQNDEVRQGEGRQDSGEVIASLEEVRNNVRSRPAVLPAWETIAVGKQLRRSDRVFTGDHAMAGIAFKNETHLTVEENSLVVMEMESLSAALDIRRGLVYIVSGEDRADVSFTVNGVKGTVKAGKSEALVRVAQDGTADVTVVKGRAVVGNTEVLSRYSTRVTKEGAVSAPVFMVLALEYPAWNADVFVETGTESRFSWVVQAPLKDQMIEFSQDALFSTVMLTLPVTGTSAIVTTPPPGQVFWRISGVAADALDGRRVFSDSRRINFITLAPPKPLRPRPDETLDYVSEAPGGGESLRPRAKAVFDWTAPYGAKAVEFEILDAASKTLITKTLARPPYLYENFSDGDFAYRLRSVFGNAKISSWSEPVPFHVKKLVAPAPLVILSPAEGEIVFIGGPRPKGVEFSFDAPAEISKTHVEIAKNQAFKELVANEAHQGLRLKWQPPTGGTFWWRARAEDVYGRTSEYTAARRLIAASTEVSLETPLPDAQLLLHSPNEPVNFSWAAVANARSYRLELAANAAFTDKLLRYETSAPTYSWVGANSGEFHWRVLALPAEGGGAIVSESRLLKVTVKISLSPPTLAPKDVLIDWGETDGWIWPALFVPVAYAESAKGGHARVSWPAVENAKEYRLQVARDIEFKEIVVDDKTDRTTYDWQNPEAENFYYRVAAIDGEGDQSAFSNAAPLRVSHPAPMLLGPPDSKRVEGKGPLSVTLRWKGVPEIDLYVVEVAAKPDFLKIEVSERTTGGVAKVSLPSEGTWHWRVRALYPNGKAASESKVSRVIARFEAVAPPRPLEPAVDASVVDNTPDVTPVRFAWVADQRLVVFAVEVSAKLDFAQNAAVMSTKATNINLNLQPGTYFWRIQGTDIKGKKTAWSVPSRFMVTAGKSSAVPTEVREEPPPTGETFLAMGQALAKIKYELTSPASNRKIQGTANQALIGAAQWWPGKFATFALRVKQWSMSLDGAPHRALSGAADGGVRLPLGSPTLYLNPYLGYANSELLLFQRNLARSSTSMRRERLAAGILGVRLFWLSGRFALRLGADYAKTVPQPGLELVHAAWITGALETSVRLSDRWTMGVTCMAEQRSIEKIKPRSSDAPVDSKLRESISYFGGFLGLLL